MQLRGDIYEAHSGKVGLQQGVIYGWREPDFHGQLARTEKEGAGEGGRRRGGFIYICCYVEDERWEFWQGGGY